MKTKSLFQWVMVAALVMCLPLCMTSCDNDDNPDNPNGGSAIVSINTATLYDKLGITDLMAELLAGGSKTVTDSVVVYDQQGLLVARLGAESTSLQNVTISLSDLPHGTYTVVAWQTSSDGPWADSFWWLTGADQLATARIIQNYPSTISWLRAIGMYTTTVTIGSETATINAEIEPMGSIVDLMIDGSASEGDYTYTSLVAGGDEPGVDGFYLNPARSGEDRWVFSASRKESSRSIAGVTPSSSSNKVFTLSHGENKEFWLFGINKNTSEKDSIINAALTLMPGTVSTFYFDLDKIGYQPPYFGPTADFAAWKAQRDAGILVNDLCIQWGADMQTVRNHVASHHLWWKCLNEELDLEEGHGWCQWYYIAKNLYEYYCFDNESGNNLLCSICICFDPNVPLEVPFTSLIKQGYDYRGGIIYPDQPNVHYSIFFSPDGNTEVTLNKYDDGGWQIFFQPTDPDDLPLIIPAVG